MTEIKKRLEPVSLFGVDIIYRNFEGREGQYNREGSRNFSVVLPEDVADQMAADGWNVRCKVSKEEDGSKLCTLPVEVSYKNRPPRVVMITSRGRQTLTEPELVLLDWADIKTVDVTINPYSWSVNGNEGVKAYAKNLFITIIEDAVELKYADVPETNYLPAVRKPLELNESIVDAEVVSDTGWED